MFNFSLFVAGHFRESSESKSPESLGGVSGGGEGEVVQPFGDGVGGQVKLKADKTA
jgi:hypothetical protein